MEGKDTIVVLDNGHIVGLLGERSSTLLNIINAVDVTNQLSDTVDETLTIGSFVDREEPIVVIYDKNTLRDV